MNMNAGNSNIKPKQSLEEAIIDLYLNVKIRKQEEVINIYLKTLNF
jgi:hypothetical protein